jgi:hypothetical protein
MDKKRLTPEELLKPRYKVIADYPGRRETMPIGHVLTLNKWGAGKWWHEYTDDEPIHLDEGSTRFPAILRPLAWWEERDEWEMPEYVKCEGPDMVLKFIDLTKTYQWDEGFPMEYEYGSYHISCFIPCTEQEYLNSLTNK